MKFRRWPTAALAVLVGALVAAGGAYAAKGGIPGPPSGGEETANNLSFPAVSETLTPVAPRWNPPAEPVLGEHFSYGCDAPETMGQFSYPNTSCVNDLDEPTVYYTADECVLPGNPCNKDGVALPVDMIFWQKVDANDWWAESDQATPRAAAYLDWGDALEAVSWSVRSQLRVETQPYGSLLVDPISGMFDPFDPALETCAGAAVRLGLDDPCRLGFQMWHVSGQGITEHWGIRTDEATSLAYLYDSPFQIIHTNNARLNVAKLVPESATCPEPGGNPGDPPPAGTFEWVVDESDEGSWAGTCEVEDMPYSVELSVGGKYVYGYNLRMKNVDLASLPGCDGWEKTGYYRLTFYTTGAQVVFDPMNPVLATGAPPAIVAQSGAIPVALAEDEEEEETDALYTPVIDYENNLTYLDICIVPKEQGGGGGGNGGNGGKPQR